jgi:hypothetical protein
MAFFPQLTTGALVQYPLRQRITTRSIVNRCPDGREIRLYDADARVLAWDLTFVALSSSEASALEALFEEVEGRLKPFTWLDPSGNLLSWSEDLTATTWVADPLLALTGGYPGPFSQGAAVRLTNTSQAPQRIRQTIAAPGSFMYCFSAWVRSDTAVTIGITMESGNSAASRTVAIKPVWTRHHHAAQLEDAAELVAFSIEVPPAGSIELFGCQAEPQPAPGPYRNTSERGGVYASARFDQDWLLMEAIAPDAFDTTVRIVTPFQG